MGCFLVLKPQLTATRSIDQKTEQKNQELQILNETLTQKKEELLSQNSQLLGEKNNLQGQIATLNNSFTQLQETTKKAAESLQEMSNNIYQLSAERAQDSMEAEAERLANYIQDVKEEYEEEYFKIMEEYAADFQESAGQYREEIEECKKILVSLKSKVQAATQAAMREEAIRNKESFYKLTLSLLDIEEIEKLRSIAIYLRNEEPLNKVIWKTYYEKAYTDLMGRIVEQPIGIYKITNLTNKMIYIGQSVDLKTRLKNHIKAGLGIDSSNNKLYTAMKKDKVENFSFEIIEYCDRQELNEKEKYWIEYFQSDLHGYNMTSGNKTKGENV